jgi:hypothetical protein
MKDEILRGGFGKFDKMLRLCKRGGRAAISRILRENGEKNGGGREKGAVEIPAEGGVFALRAAGQWWHVFSLNKISLSKHLTAGAIYGNQHGLFHIVLRRGAWHL